MTGSKETFCIIDTSSNIMFLLILALCAVIVLLLLIRLIKRVRTGFGPHALGRKKTAKKDPASDPASDDSTT